MAILSKSSLEFSTLQGGVAGKGKEEAVAVETKAKVVQETIIIEEGERTLEDLIEEQRAKLHKEGKKVWLMIRTRALEDGSLVLGNLVHAPWSRWSIDELLMG